MATKGYRKTFYVTFHKDDRELAWKYATVVATLHADAVTYADHFWGSRVSRIRGSGAGYELRNDKRYSELKWKNEHEQQTQYP